MRFFYPNSLNSEVLTIAETDMENTPKQVDVVLDKNSVYKYIFKNAPLRLVGAEMHDGWKEMIQFQHLPPAIVKLLGEFTAGTLLLASTIKFDGSVMLQVQGSGAIGLLVVEIRGGTQIRAMAKVRIDAVITENSSVQELINADNDGKCIMVLDPKDRKQDEAPYQGIVELKGNSVSEILENYMRTSEQLDTRIVLAANEEKIAGILLQKMPESGGKEAANEDADAWDRTCQLLNTATQKELLTPYYLPELIGKIFWQEDVAALGSKAVEFSCTCDREKTDNLLRSLGRADLEDILKTEGKIEVRCQFCNRVQLYTAEDVGKLFPEKDEWSEADPKRPN